MTSALLSVIYAGSVESTTYNMVSNTRKVFHPSTPDKYNTVLLKVVTFTRNVCCNF